MDDFALSCFVKVAQLKSFTDAARAVGRTQSAVTQIISKLETQFQKKLFLRGKQTLLTEDGEIFLSYAKKILELYAELNEQFLHPELEGEISFGVPEDFATMFLADILSDFARIHPRILLNVECDLTLNLFERFQKGLLDIVLVKMVRPQDFPLGVDIWSEPLEWVVSQSGLVNFDKQKPFPLILSPEPCVYRARAIEVLRKANIPWRMAVTSPSHLGTLAAVKAGMGFTVLPRTMIPDSIHKVKDPFLPALPDIHVSLLKQSDSDALRTLEEFLLGKLGQGQLVNRRFKTLGNRVL